MDNDQNAIQTKDVTAALSFFIDISMALSVDTEGYIFSTVDPNHKRIKIGTGDQEKPAVVYQEVIPKDEVHIINPFAEGLGDRTPPQIFFYKLLRASLNARLSYAIDGVITLALEQRKLLTATSAKKTKDAPPPPRLPLRIVDILARKISDDTTVLDEVDDKTLEEFHKFLDQHADRVLEPVYKPSLQRTDVLVSIIDDPGFIASIHSMRKKSIAVLQAVIRGIFGVGPDDTFEQFNSKRIDGAPSKLSSWLKTLFLLYHPLNEVIDALPAPDAPDHLVNLDVYQYHLDRLPGYTNNAKWMVMAAAAPAPAPTAAVRQPGQPWSGGVPQLTPTPLTLSTPPGAGSSSSSTVPPGYKLMPGATMIDGTRGPPVLIPDLGAQGTSPPVMLQPAPVYAQPYQSPPASWMPQQQPWYPPMQQPYGGQPFVGPYPGGGTINPLMAGAQQPALLGGFHPNMGGWSSPVPGMPPLR